VNINHNQNSNIELKKGNGRNHDLKAVQESIGSTIHFRGSFSPSARKEKNSKSRSPTKPTMTQQKPTSKSPPGKRPSMKNTGLAQKFQRKGPSPATRPAPQPILAKPKQNTSVAQQILQKFDKMEQQFPIVPGSNSVERQKPNKQLSVQR